VTIGTRGLALLQSLLRANGEVVTRSSLMDAAWGEASIEESNLTVQMAALRKCLGVPENGREWIATVPRVGYRFAGAARVEVDRTVALAPGKPFTERTSKQSIAVLPFANMSSDPEQEYFGAGLAEDLITDLSKVPGLTVIARNSSFAYRGPSTDIRLVARDLGVRYMVEGSVCRAADRVRISAQLIDALDGSHLWADRFDRDLADIFALQDEIVSKIVNALAGIIPGVRTSAARQRTSSIQAHDLFIRGRMLSTYSPEGTKSARPLLEASIAIDPNFAEAHAWLAMSHHFGWLYWGEPVEPHRTLSRETAERAVLLDPECADAHWILGYVRAYDGDLSKGVAGFDAALRINPSHADAWAFLADLKVFEGRPADAIQSVNTAFRLNPHPPGVYFWLLGWAQYAGGDREGAVATLRKATAHGTGARRVLAASLAWLGRVDEAQHETAQFISTYPHFSASQWARTQQFQRKEDLEHFVVGYLKAGLPP
jgi:TolB-like protein